MVSKIDLIFQPRRKNIYLNNKTRFSYPEGRKVIVCVNGCPLCWAGAEATTQFNGFDLSAFKKQLLIF